MRISDWSSDVCSSDLVAVLAHETHQEPALALAAILATPHLADHMVGQVIKIFLAAALDDVDEAAVDAGFLAQLAVRGGFCILAGVDSALRHLPRLARCIVSLADEDAPVAIGQHHPRAGAVGQACKIGHVCTSSIRSPSFRNSVARSSSSIALSMARLPLISFAALGMPCAKRI